MHNAALVLYFWMTGGGWGHLVGWEGAGSGLRGTIRSPSHPSTAPTADACIDVQHLARQLQRAREMNASIIIGAFAAGAGLIFPALLLRLSPAAQLQTLPGPWLTCTL